MYLPIAMKIVLALFISIIILDVPESPLWLAQKEQFDQATGTLLYVSNLPVGGSYTVGKHENILDVV